MNIKQIKSILDFIDRLGLMSVGLLVGSLLQLVHPYSFIFIIAGLIIIFILESIFRISHNKKVNLWKKQYNGGKTKWNKKQRKK